jgi:hypothetical protein
MQQTKIYLDIDGVLLANELNAANYAKEFIEHIVTNYPVYWLTTHCQGDASVPVSHIKHLFDEGTVSLLETILPTTWKTAKSEAIDFDSPFLWFDDDLYSDELKALHEHHAMDSFIEVDLAKNPDALRAFLISFPIPLTATKKL